MLHPISQSTKAFFDTVILKLEGEDRLLDVSAFYGIPYIRAYKVNWRKALQAGALGRRGTFGTLFDFVRQATMSLDESATYEVKTFNELTIVGGSPPDPSWLGRLVDIGDRIYMVADINGNDLVLAWVKTGYWAAADLTQRYSISTQVTVRCLAFMISEPTPGKLITSLSTPVEFSEYLGDEWKEKGLSNALQDGCTVYINSVSITTPTPPTYMQPAGALARPVGEPYGGQLQLDASLEGQSDAFGGPHPPYLVGTTAFQQLLDSIRSLLAAGIKRFSHRKNLD